MGMQRRLRLPVGTEDPDVAQHDGLARSYGPRPSHGSRGGAGRQMWCKGSDTGAFREFSTISGFFIYFRQDNLSEVDF